MTKKIYPTPSISEESRFHEMNALIVKSQKLLCSNSTLACFEVNILIRTINLSRVRAAAFNKKFGLKKEIA